VKVVDSSVPAKLKIFDFSWTRYLPSSPGLVFSIEKVAASESRTKKSGRGEDWRVD